MQVSYTTKINSTSTDVIMCNADEYELNCKKYNCFECIPDNRPVRMYFDFDYGQGHCKEPQNTFYIEEMTDTLVALAIGKLTLVLTELFDTEPIFAVKKQSSSSYPKTNKIGVVTHTWKYSFHLIVTNIAMLKLEQLAFVKDFNNMMKTTQDDADNYGEYLDCDKSFTFFDESVYNTNGKMRSAYCSKKGENRPSIITRGSFMDTIISYNKDSIILTYKTNKEHIVHKNAVSILTQSSNASKMQDLLFIIKINQKDRIWLPICDAIKANGGTENDWLQFCSNNNLNMDKEKEDLFSKVRGENSLKFLEKLAKESNLEYYNEWLNKWNIYTIQADDLDDPYKTAVVISTSLKETLVLCNESWYMLNELQLWKKQKEPSYYIINELRKYIDASNKQIVGQIAQSDGEVKDKLIELSKKYLKSYKSISSSGFLNVITKYLKTLLADDAFANKLDANKGKLAFQNGIMDLETKQFRQGILSSDFVTETIPYDYDESSYDYIKSVLKKILNNNDSHLEYFLSIIGYSFIGQPDLEKSIYFMIDKTEGGNGDNGKTFLFDILNTLMPCYVYRTKASLIELNNTKVHKQLVMTKGKRLLWLEELPKEKNTNAELMKEIGDGKQLENEVMFGTSETINVMFKMFALSNHIPKIDPNEKAVYNRYKQVSFNSHFDRSGNRTTEIPKELKFIADTSLSQTIKDEYFNEVFNLVIEYAHRYYTKKLPVIPSQFLADTKETQNKNDSFGCWFDETCAIDSNERVALKLLVKESGMSEKLVKEGMERKGLKYNKDLRKLGVDSMSGNHYKGGYLGVKYICPDSDSDVDSDFENEI